MNEIALLLFTMFYTPPKPDFFQIIPAPVVIEQAAPVPATAPQVEYKQPTPAKQEPGGTDIEGFYGYSCPDGGWPIGDGQCHLPENPGGEVQK